MYYETSLFKKGNKMKFFSRLVLIFALLLIISALLFCIFIQSSYATKPIEKMLSSYTNQEIIIGNIEYNVKYPETIVFQNVKIGNFFYANKIYVDVDYSELLNKNLYINELNIVDSKINIQGLNKFQLTKPLNNLFIKQGLLKNIIFEDEDLKIDNSIIEVKNLLLIKDKKFDNNPSISMALHTPKIKYKDTEIQSLDIIAKYDKAHNLYKVNELKFDFKDGNVATNFIINEQTKSINIFNLNISNVDNLENILINQAANLPRLLSDWNFTIHEGKISDSSYYNPHNKLGLSNIDLQLDQISINKGNVTDLRFNSTVEKANIKNITLNDLSITYNHFNKKNDISFSIDGKFLDNTFKSIFNYEQDKKRLIIEKLYAEKLILPETTEALLLNDLIYLLPDNLRINTIDVNDLSFSSLDHESYPIILKNGNLHLKNIEFEEGKLANTSSNYGAIEFFFDNLFIKNVEISKFHTLLSISENKITSKFAETIVNGISSLFKFNIDIQNQKLSINYIGKKLPISTIYPFIGTNNLTGLCDVDLKSTFSINRYFPFEYNLETLNTNLIFDDLFVSSFDIEQFSNSNSHDIYNKLKDSNIKEKNFIVVNGNLKLNYQQPIFYFEGSAKTLDKQYTFNGKYNKIDTSMNTFNMSASKNAVQKTMETNKIYILENSKFSRKESQPIIDNLPPEETVKDENDEIKDE